MATALYARISKDRYGTELGVDRQLADLQHLADRRGSHDPALYVDNDITASRRGGVRKHRPEFQRLLQDVKNGVIDEVLAWDFDRLFRDPLEQEEFLLMCEQRGLVKIATLGDDVDIDSGHGLLVARIKAAVAAEEVRKISQRGRRKHLQLAETGQLHGGGTRPFGYEADRVTVRPDEADLIAEACRRILAREPLRSIVVDWNARGATTTSGGAWTTHTLKRIITSARIAGWREHHGDFAATAIWPAIVDRDTVEQLRAVLRDPARRTNRGGRRYLLTGGLARCDLCKAPLVARPRDDGARRYICAKGPGLAGCGRLYVLADPLDLYVLDIIAETIDSDAYAARYSAHANRPPGDDPATEIAACEAKLAVLAEQWAADDLTRGEWVAARQTVQQRLDAARRRQTAPPPTFPTPGTGGDLVAGWTAKTVDEQRAVVTSIIDTVTIGAGRRGYNRFDSARVLDIAWRI